ncbi:MAG: Ger(x)C family spore germination protein [Ectobacillus sp.]
MKKGCIILLTLIMIVPLAGCWSRRELNDLAIAVGLAIDKTGKNEYLISVQVVDPSEVTPKQGGGGRAPVTVYQQKANTVFEGLRKITTIAPRKIYLSHLRILVLGEAVAKEGIGKSLELLSRDHEIRSDFFIVLAKDTSASSILKFISPLEKIPAQKLYKSLEVSQKAWAPTHTIQLDELIASMTSDGKEAVLTTVMYTGTKKIGGTKTNVEQVKAAAHLQYFRLAVLRKDKLVGWLSEKESKGFSYISSEVKSTVGKLACPKKGWLVIEIFNANAKVKARLHNGKPKIDIYSSLEANIGEVRCDVDLTKAKTIDELEKIFAQHNREILMSAVKKAKRLKSDIFGFGEAIHRTSPKTWEKLKKDWNTKGFVNVPVEIHVDAKIRRTGTMNKSYLEDLKE